MASKTEEILINTSKIQSKERPVEDLLVKQELYIKYPSPIMPGFSIPNEPITDYLNYFGIIVEE